MSNIDESVAVLTSAALDAEGDKITIVWNVDGPIALVENDDFAWLTIISCSMNEGKKVAEYLNVDNIRLAEEMVKGLKFFIKNKKAEDRKKERKGQEKR